MHNSSNCGSCANDNLRHPLKLQLPQLQLQRLRKQLRQLLYPSSELDKHRCHERCLMRRSRSSRSWADPASDVPLNPSPARPHFKSHVSWGPTSHLGTSGPPSWGILCTLRGGPLLSTRLRILCTARIEHKSPSWAWRPTSRRNRLGTLRQCSPEIGSNSTEVARSWPTSA